MGSGSEIEELGCPLGIGISGEKELLERESGQRIKRGNIGMEEGRNNATRCL